MSNSCVRDGFILQLEEKDMQVALVERNENPEETADLIQDFRKTLNQMKHFNIRVDDEFLLMFLRSANFSKQRALEAIENLAKLRVTDPYQQVYTNEAKLSPAVVELLSKGIIFFVPQLAPSNGRAMILRPGLVDTKVITPHDWLEACILSIEIALLDPATQIHGIHKVFDFTECGLIKSATLFSPSVQTFAVKTVATSLPLTLRGYHLCFVPLMIHTAFRVLRPFFSPEVARRFFSHRDEASIHAVIDPRILPEELGGSAGKCQDLADRWFEHVRKHLDYFGSFSSVTYDEEKKPPGEASGDC